METNNLIINIDWTWALGIIGVLILIAWNASGKFSVISEGIKNIKEKISRSEGDVRNIEKDVRSIKERLGIVETKMDTLSTRMDTLWKDRYAPTGSPRQLNDTGTRILNDSGIKELIDKNKERLFNLVKEKKSKNAYDAEAATLSVVMEFAKHCPEEIEKLKSGAFRAGVDIDALLFIGGIYLRNIIFKDLGFSLGDLDKPSN